VSAVDADQLLVGEWRQLLARHATTWCALERALQERHGLSASEFEVLERLAEGCKGQYRVQELADAAYLSQSALSRLIARLEHDGLVTRSMCELDRRGIYVCLTDAGRERHAAARPTQRAVLADSLQVP
jgi:DNA-binding MarR family transcriptional regulator